MAEIVKQQDNKLQIDSKAAFCELLNHKLPPDTKLFTEIIKEFDDAILKKYPKVHASALSNVHGDWYEWFIALSAWNYFAKTKGAYLALTLPNIVQFDVVELYEKSLYDLVVDLRNKVQQTASVRLITSNPDFVIIDRKYLESPALELPKEISKPIEKITEDALHQIEKAYAYFISKCTFDGIIGYISAKSSLRPDRRLQIPHEGSLMKAIYTHLQTRKWIINPPGLKYYAFTTAATDADKKALKTVATHSITTVFSIPQAAVDEVFVVNSLADCNAAFKRILF